jgi:hypothetical protein
MSSKMFQIRAGREMFAHESSIYLEVG